MSLDDIIKRNQRYAKRSGFLGRHPIANLVASELDDPSADAEEIKHRILAMAIVVGVIVAIIALVALL